MPISDKPLIVVVGSTGAQGGSVIKSLHETGKYRIRGLTRNPDGQKARELKEKYGVEIVKCDIGEKKEVEAAFDGAYGVYAVTNFWDSSIAVKGNVGMEEVQGKIMADVAREKKIKHLIWSSLDDVEGLSFGKLKHVYHFTGKNHVEVYIRKNLLPATFMYMGFYMTNLYTYFPPTKTADGYEWALGIKPDVRLPWVDPKHDVGPIVAKILENKDEYMGKIVHVAGEYKTMPEVCETLTKVLGKKFTYRYVEIKEEELKAAEGKELKGKEMIDLELKEMLTYFNMCGYYNGRDISETKKINPGMSTVESWARRGELKLPE
ncbi:hypothetical protein BKA69DRAFT_430219 [Paraphysoderma sedebokerense]|nr:hypothetical protein BKA69DRAFT_430219 [Paraphysoderma sedebokerense]